MSIGNLHQVAFRTTHRRKLPGLQELEGAYNSALEVTPRLPTYRPETCSSPKVSTASQGSQTDSPDSPAFRQTPELLCVGLTLECVATSLRVGDTEAAQGLGGAWGLGI